MCIVRLRQTAIDDLQFVNRLAFVIEAMRVYYEVGYVYILRLT
jgi:hypothetical protein